mmetsp:Transcript_12469/g.38127  ORF Transcript_12469/g.38127 Transcript_12469/m.38127 type:complete len:372 (+) Transcript_12469:490-1605(+)
MARVNLHSLLRRHVRRHGVVAESLSTHNALHVGGPTVLAGDEDARRLGDTFRHDHLFDLVAEDLLHELAEWLEIRGELLPCLLLLLGLLELEALLRNRDKLLAVVLLELLHTVLIDGVRHEQHLIVALLATLNEGRSLDSLLALTGNVVDVLLRLRHTRNVVLKQRHLISGLGGVVHEKLSKLGTVARILMNAQLDVLRELLVELLEVLCVLRDLSEEFNGLLDNVLLDDLEDLVLLKSLTGDVERKILRVNDTLHKSEPLRDEVLAVVHDEHATDIKLDVPRVLLLWLEEIEGCTLRHEEDRGELKLSLNREVLHSKVLLPVIRECLVESAVFLLCHLLGLAGPDGLLLVHEVPFMGDLLDLLLLLLLLL